MKSTPMPKLSSTCRWAACVVVSKVRESLAVPGSKAVPGSRSQRLQPMRQTTMLNNGVLGSRRRRLETQRWIAMLRNAQRLRHPKRCLQVPKSKNLREHYSTPFCTPLHARQTISTVCTRNSPATMHILQRLQRPQPRRLSTRLSDKQRLWRLRPKWQGTILSDKQPLRRLRLLLPRVRTSRRTWSLMGDLLSV